MKLIYGIHDKPKFGQTLVFAFQQMIAIMAATLLVPMLMNGMSGGSLYFDPAAALFGAGAGTIIYLLFTKRRSPVFLGSSFTFLGAYAAVIGANYGYWGVIIGVAFAGLVYVVIALIIKLVGSGWINKLMSPVIIGPIVTLIGLSLSSTATGWMSSNGGESYSLLWILVGALTFLAIAWTSVKGTKMMKLIPFIIGIGFGYVVALCFTGVGYIIENAAENAEFEKALKMIAVAEEFKMVSFQPFIDTFKPFTFRSIVDVPEFTIVNAFKQGFDLIDGKAIANIALTFVPIGIVELAQHMADHKNLSNIVEQDLITDPGMHRTLLGDGVGSIVGAIFGGAANTTYGESIGCVAITKNASIVSIFWAAIGCLVLSFFSPFVAVINSIPKCVMGGACIAMYGFIAVSGLQMLKLVDLNDNKNLYVVASILVTGIGGLALNFGTNKFTGGGLISFGGLATALIIGLITNVIVNFMPGFKSNEETDKQE
ncbi:MAG: uracil-xanthine permease [Clostridia bacterium]|nr:uracil-xanthine permease [Clostridia bacterium]